jgi:V8-like Glu-specific endopeptidase
MKKLFKIRIVAIFTLVSLLFACTIFQASAEEIVMPNETIDAVSDAQYIQVPSTINNAMYVGKSVETGTLNYFNVNVIGERATTYSNGVIERSAPAYFPPELIQEQIENETATTFGIIGNDSRQRVTVSNSLPYSAIARIKINWPDDEITYGTAWMFYGDIAITAGHCVYDTEKHVWAESIEVWVGMNGTVSSARAVGYSRTLYTSNLWISSGQVKDDWGVIELTEDIASSTGYLGLYYSTADMSGRSIEISGYPYDHPGWQYTASGTIDYCEEAALFYMVDAVGCQSGSPILIDGTNKAAVIHGTGYYYPDPETDERIYTRNGGARMTPSLFDYLMSFRD